MYHFIKLTLCSFFFLATLHLAGQSAAAVNKIGDETRRGTTLASLKKAAVNSAIQSDHFSALKYWELAVQADSSIESLSGYADAAFKIQNYEKTDAAFQQIFSKKPTSLSTAQVLNWAEVKYRRRDFAGAEGLYNSVLDKIGATTDEIDAAQGGLENIRWAKDVIQNLDENLKIERLGEAVNSSESEFAPFLVGDTLYFTSFNFELENDNHTPNRKQGKIRTSVTDAAGNQEITTANFNDAKKITAHTAFNRTGNLMFFTVCDYVKSAEIQCGIYMKMRDSSGESAGNWGGAVRLPDAINAPGYTTTEPNVGWDAAGKQEILFFSSDRLGSKGNRDLWYSLILGESGFSDPVNLTLLNTPGDEVSPFYHQKNGALFFSSDGYQSLGGKDIFVSRGWGLKWAAPVHLGFPTNSDHDDAYYFLSNDEKTAYFSSNRAEANDKNEEYCCPDIFKIDLRKPEIIAITFNEETGDTLSETRLVLTETSGSNEEFKFKVAGTVADLPAMLDKKYVLVSSKEGFRSDTISFDTPAEIWPSPLVKKLFLRPDRINLVANIFDKRDSKPLPGATCRFLDLGKVLPGGTLATGRGSSPLLEKTDLDPSGNIYRYGLEFDHRYRVVVMKDGYTVDSVEVTTEGMSTTTTISKKLYLTKGLNLVARAFEANTKLALNGTQIRFFEIPTGRFEKGENLTGNQYNYGLDFEKHYRVVIVKMGYLPDSVDFTTNNGDLANVSFQTLTKDLYLKPLDLAAYLPVILYFDNDEPDKRTTRITTSQTYDETYEKYIPRESAFLSNFLSDMHGTANSSSSQLKIEAFFEQNVKAGYEKLLRFSTVLKAHLDAGGSVKIQITGFASPRANDDYNRNLTSRRIWSVKNHFEKFQNGVLLKYLTDKKLSIEEVPQGEAAARGKNISDVISDEKGSVYSVEASLERRVEIHGVDLKDSKLFKKVREE